MPPKKKGKGKGKGKKGPTLIDGVDTSQMNRDELEAFALRLKAEMEREREERNYFQLERDKIRTFWEIARAQLEELTSELRQKDKEVEMAQELSDIDKKNINQQMKHLQYENFTKIGEIRAEALTQLKIAQEEHVAQEQELERDKRELRRCLRETEQINMLQVHQLKMSQSEVLTVRRIQFENEAKDMRLMFDIKMQNLKAEIELVNRMQMFEVEERKNTQIHRLVSSHEAAFVDMKNYYNDITLNNLGLISSLKEQLEALRKQAERSERITAETMNENRKLKEPLDAAQAELYELRRKLEHFERDRCQLARIKTRNTHVEKHLSALTWETEALVLQNKSLVEQRDELKNKFDQVFMELQQKTGLKNVLLERKIAQMERAGEKREVMLKQTMAICEAETKAQLNVQVDDVLEEKNKQIQELSYELARITKAHDDLLSTFEAKLKQYDIPIEELGFEPLRMTTKLTYLCGPAGLVSKNQ